MDCGFPVKDLWTLIKSKIIYAGLVKENMTSNTVPNRYLPLVLFSGMAADPNIFVGQKIAWEQLVVPQWPVPLANETLDEYAKRFAEGLKGAEIGILGGASFGGIVALHVAQYLRPKAILLIGSVTSPAELPRYARWLRPMRRVIRFLPVRLMQVLATPLAASVFKKLHPGFSGLLKQFVRCDSRVMKWSLERVLGWEKAPNIDAPVFHIHGDRDWMLPLKNTTADRIVRGGGHLISLTHAPQVNDYIGEITESCSVRS